MSAKSSAIIALTSKSLNMTSVQRLEQQLDELELLQSVFSEPGEFHTDDQAVVDHATAYVKGLTDETPNRLACGVHLTVDAVSGKNDEEEETYSTSARCTVDIAIRMSHSYPMDPPDVYVSSNDLTRRGQDDLNSDLGHFISTLPPGEVCLLSIVEWIRDNAREYCPIPKTDTALELDTGSGTTFCRMWLYMHHIYSKTKRRNILDLAEELGLTGFCLPGKPGVVCVEGDMQTTKHFYSILRRWNWKSITCKEKEVVSGCTVASQRMISGFQELSFETHGPKQNHMDMGQFRAYLQQHGLQYMFNKLFGIEGEDTEKL